MRQLNRRVINEAIDEYNNKLFMEHVDEIMQQAKHSKNGTIKSDRILVDASELEAFEPYSRRDTTIAALGLQAAETEGR